MYKLLIPMLRFCFCIAILLMLASCDYECYYRTGDVGITMTFPENDSKVGTDDSGFLTVEGVSFGVHRQVCPNDEEAFGEVFIVVEAPPARPLFIQDEHAYPTPEGNWSVSTHLGLAKPLPGEEFTITAFVVSKVHVSTIEQLDTLQSLADLKKMGIEVAASETVRVVIE